MIKPLMTRGLPALTLAALPLLTTAPATAATTAQSTAAAAPAAVATVVVVRRDLPEAPSAAVARAELTELMVEAPHSMTGYSRAKFPHWAQQGERCDTREVVLARDGQDVQRDSECRAVSGTWVSPYDDKVLTSASQVDIDHIVPLANAWRSGADLWDTARRKSFANDLEGPQLLTVSAASNRSKGDQSPDQWSPPSRAYWCTYSRAWTHIKYTYQLAVTEPERDQLTTMLGTCS
ncbi:HNH endonuclease family protein [Streptomyces sp. G-G2]|uniref:HNH endonuclease family protein n=1 Tax=Streptomyces sp. G-G2 TaxID=3046201 RepID=UPI0024B94EBF|nr:HNH endonuclease family protein [Streptomyces sp. G-G2]MDJ0386083.1 HNH endonuclease family protein [Streptomyces sp. G-G2]